MAVKAWNWHSTNYSSSFYDRAPPMVTCSELALVNASKAEVEKAYNALVNKGPISDFSVKVWNDICAKVYDISKVWDVNRLYLSSAVWSPFMHTSNRALWAAYAQEHWPSKTSDEVEEWVDNMFTKYHPGRFYASMYNRVYTTWLMPVGKEDFTVYAGQEIKGEYILKLTDALNHWISLTPLGVKGKDAWVLSMTAACANSIYSIALQIDTAAMEHLLTGPMQQISSVQMQWQTIFALASTQPGMELLRSIQMSSPMNFSTLHISCKIWDKNIVYLGALPVDGQMDGRVRAVLDAAIKGAFSSEFQFDMSISAGVCGTLAPMQIRWSAAQAAESHPALAGHIDLRFCDSSTHTGKGKVRTMRPLPMQALTQFVSDSTAFVEYEGIENIEMESGGVQFAHDFSADVDDGLFVEQTGKIKIVDELELAREDAVQMEQSGRAVLSSEFQMIDGAGKLLGDTSVLRVQSEELELHEATGAEVFHVDCIDLNSAADIAQDAPNALTHTSHFRSTSSFELSFANETSVEVQSGSFSVTEQAIELAFQNTQNLVHDGGMATSEAIFLQDAPPLELMVDSTVQAGSSGELERDRVKEQSGEAVIRTESTADVSFGLNKILELDAAVAEPSVWAALIKMHVKDMEGAAQAGTQSEAAVHAIIRRLLEAEAAATSSASGEVLLRRIHFIEGAEVVSLTAEADPTAALPKFAQSKDVTVSTSQSAFVDIGYIRGGGLQGEGFAGIGAEIELAQVDASTQAGAAAKIYTLQETMLQRTPARELDGITLAETGSEARLIMARSEQILASEYEDTLASELDELLASDAERHLIFDE